MVQPQIPDPIWIHSRGSSMIASIKMNIPRFNKLTRSLVRGKLIDFGSRTTSEAGNISKPLSKMM